MPILGPSIKKVISQIDNDKDFRDYFSRLLVAATKIERGDLNVDSVSWCSNILNLV